MNKKFKIWRDKNGIPHVEAANLFDLYQGFGYAHATDRGMQMLLMRILGQGRVSELLDASEESLNIDIFFRKMNWAANIEEELAKLNQQEIRCLDSYCDGINSVLNEKIPWEFKLLGYKYEQWKKEDCIALSRMIGYLTLAQSQAEMERLFVEMVQAGLSKEKLDEIFPNILGGLDIELIKKVKLPERIIPPNLLWGIGAPRMMASNNWVISGTKTDSGEVIVANDPHLEANRLPNVWCEIALKIKDRFMMGGTMPGLPGVLAGRTNDIAWGATYSFADAVDSWIEKCKDGKYYREGKAQWIDFNKRTEIIKRKKKDPVEVTFYENDHGVLDGNPFEEGYYLATDWAANKSGAKSFSAIFKIREIKSTAEAMDTLGELETSWYFVIGDKKGNIGFQTTGKLPKRKKGVSGFVPLPGWKSDNNWSEFLSVKELPRILNPKQGFFVTANQALNEFGKTNPINMPMGRYRADRITNLLANGDNFTIDDMYKMHYDVYSLQAEYFMKILKPLLPDTPQGKILREWDLKYTADSKGAFLFENFYTALYREVFGKADFGEQVIEFLQKECGTFIDFYENFDRILLSKRSSWFGGR
ncbi:hypothetical protein B6I21_08600, partial [candidate division KSB1 bacterium 4572_119]